MNQRSRFLALKDEDRARWLDAAEQEFCALGYEKASLNRILANAGESKGRSYHYFSGKGELFRATLERRISQIDGLNEDLVLNARTAQAFWAETAALCTRLTAAFQQNAPLANLMRVLHFELAAQQSVAEPLATLRAKIEKILITGQSLGAVRRDLPIDLLGMVALELASTIDRWFAQNAQTLTDTEEQALSQRAFSLIAAPFLPPSY